MKKIDYPYISGWLIGAIKSALNLYDPSDRLREHLEETLKEVEDMKKKMEGEK